MLLKLFSHKHFLFYFTAAPITAHKRQGQCDHFAFAQLPPEHAAAGTRDPPSSQKGAPHTISSYALSFARSHIRHCRLYRGAAAVTAHVQWHGQWARENMCVRMCIFECVCSDHNREPNRSYIRGRSVLFVLESVYMCVCRDCTGTRPWR